MLKLVGNSFKIKITIGPKTLKSIILNLSYMLSKLSLFSLYFLSSGRTFFPKIRELISLSLELDPIYKLFTLAVLVDCNIVIKLK